MQELRRIMVSLPLAILTMSRHEILVSQNEKINSSKYCLITYILYVLKRSQYPIKSFETHVFQNQFLESQIIALSCLS